MTALLLLLTSCAAGEDRAAAEMLEIRSALLAATGVTATANIRADYGERVFDFQIRFRGDGSLGEITIIKPDNLAGVTARVSDDGARLMYDGAALDTGPLGDGLSPAGIIPVLLAEWKGGFVGFLDTEKAGSRETLAMSSALTDTSSQRTWFDMKTNLPTRSEVVSNGRTVLTLVFENVAYE
jgi:hypothetical protein